MIFLLAPIFAAALESVTAPTMTTAATAPTAPAEISMTAAPATAATESAEMADSEPVSLLEVSVTATRLPGDPMALPPMITIVDAEAIGRKPAGQTPNLLVGEPGILIQKSNHGGGSPFIHGLTGKQVLLLVDGVRMNNSLYRFGPHQYLNTIDPYTIERIEVVRGPGSVLYGSDALGGVINIITKDPSKRAVRGGIAVGGASADSSLHGRFQLDGQVARTGVLAGASGRRFQNLRAGGGIGIQPATGYDELSADVKLSQSLTDRIRITGATQLVRQYNVPKSNEVLLGGKVKYDYEPQLRWLTYAQLHADRPVSFLDAIVLSASLQTHEEGEEIIDAVGKPERRERSDARTFGTSLHLSKELPFGNTLGIGGEWYADRIHSEAVEASTTGTRVVRPTFPDASRYESYGVYLQDEWRPFKSVGLLVGGRYSRFRANGSLPGAGGAATALHLDAGDFTSSAGLTWEFLPGLYVAGQAAQGFRAPNMEDFFGKVDFQKEIPNPDLKAEKSNDYEAGFKVRRWGFEGETFYYRTYHRDMIDRADVMADVDGDGVTEKVAQRRNIGRARIHGVESGLRHAFKRLETFATYSWTFGDKLALKNGAWEPVEPLRRIPPRQGMVGARVLLPQESFVGLEAEWSKRQDRLAPGDKTDPRIGPFGTPGYGVANLRAGLGWGDDSRLRFGVENVLDKQYKTHGSGIWLAGRNFYVDYSIGL